MSLHVINREVLARATSRVVKRADYEHLVAAGEVLGAAQVSAARLQLQLDTLRQEAMRAGYAAGIEMGKQAWAQQLAEQNNARQLQLSDLNGTLVEAVMTALRHLVGELPAGHQFEMLARQVLNSVVRAKRLRLVVAPADAAAAYSVLERWQREHTDVLTIDVVVEESLTAGDCIVETDEGAIDGRLDQRLVAVEAAFSRHLAAVVRPGGVPATVGSA